MLSVHARGAIVAMAVLAVVGTAVPVSASPATVPSVTVLAGAPEPSGFGPGTTRLSGASRYDTAVQVSQQYSPGVPAVFVAAGTNFPDALSAAAAAAYVGGPLLLTAPTSLPDVVNAEIVRLDPAMIYVVGGTAAVSDDVVAQLQLIAPVTRFGGATRYDTGLGIVNGIFNTTTTAIIATGRSFPDALAATGVAGKLNAPVILVDGAQATVPVATLQTLTDLGVSNIIIAGGTAVVSSSVETQLRTAGYTVTRFGGSDRFGTAAALNDAYFPHGSTDTMFLATGSNFPDALAGAALAGRLGAPLYITSATCAPAGIYTSVNTLAPTKKAVLGGVSAVTDAAADNWNCDVVAAPGYQTALQGARDLSDANPSLYSRSWLIDDVVEMYGVGLAEATYGVDAIGADWKQYAALWAEYLVSDGGTYARADVVDFLLYLGFTVEEANYGADANGY